MAAAARYQPRLIKATAVSLTLLTLLLWVGLRGSLPLAPAGDGLYGWAIDAPTWSLGGAWLLLLLGALLLSRQPAGAPQISPWPQSGAMLLLGGVGLAALWAGTPALALTAWLALALAWGAAARSQLTLGARALARPLAGLLLAALGLWYGAALGGGADWATWPAAARTAALLAILVQMGSIPLVGGRVLALVAGRETAVLLLLAPSMAGAAMLLRLVATGPTPHLPLLTLVALLGVLAGLWRAWANRAEPAQVGAALALTAGGLLVLAGVWAGPAAAAAEGRVLALAVGGVFLARPLGARPPGRDGWLAIGPQLAGWLLALAALAGLPLTAGFNGRAALYQAWLTADGWALVLVTALLHIPLTAVIFLAGLAGQQDAAEPPAAAPDLAAGAGRLLLAVGLLAWPALPLGEVAVVAWLALLLPAAAGLLLARWGRHAPPWETAVRWPVNGLGRRLGRLAQPAINAVYDAADLLEGERGLLWLLLLAALLALASGS